jgi:quinol monooxygenase YgiN
VNDIRLNGRLIFDCGDYETVASICDINASDAREHPGMIEYSFWANEDHTEIYIHEHYADADSFVNHMGNLNQDAVTRLLGVARLGTMECCLDIDVDPRVTTILSQYGVPMNIYALVVQR